jgi:hypothetical protein
MGQFESTLDVRGAFSKSLRKPPKEVIRIVRVDLSARPATHGKKTITEVFVLFCQNGTGLMPEDVAKQGAEFVIDTVVFAPTLLRDTEHYGGGDSAHTIERDAAIGCLVDEVSGNFAKLSYSPTGVDYRHCAWTGSAENFRMASGDVGLGYPLKIYRQDGTARLLVEPRDEASVQKQTAQFRRDIKDPKKMMRATERLMKHVGKAPKKK